MVLMVSRRELKNQMHSNRKWYRTAVLGCGLQHLKRFWTNFSPGACYKRR